MGACGGGASPDARALLDETFGSHEPITSGRISLRLALTAEGARQPPGEGLALRLRGPFQSLGSTQLPRFALQVDLRSPGVRAPGHVLHAGATAIGGRLFITLDGRHFLAPPAVAAALGRGYAAAAGGVPAHGSRPSLATFGLEPRAWLQHPRIAGSARVAGTDTTHILAGIDVARFLADMQKLGAAGVPLIAEGAEAFDALSPALSSSVRSARADIYTGKTDHLLRRLVLSASIPPAAAAPTAALSGKLAGTALGGSRGATLSLAIDLALLNQPQRILAPGHLQPLAQLPAELERLGLAPPG